MKRATLREFGPGMQTAGPVNPRDGVWMLPGFGNTGVVETGEGLVLVDVPSYRMVDRMMTWLRERFSAPIHTVFVSHGHLDHAFSFEPIFAEAAANHVQPPRIIGHRNVIRRFNRYRMLDKYHDYINRIQFAVPENLPAFPIPQRNPDITFDQSLSLSVGGLDFHAYHELGETDDSIWIWVPEKKTVMAGDMIVASIPNVGNPFKVQRYTLEWAEGLEAILAKEPELIIPGHGPVIEGKENIRRTLMKISGALRYLHDEVVKRLNAGMWYEDILHEVTLPPEMTDDEFMAPRYGCPTFIVHGVLRQYTGWYDGNPSNLFPPKRADVSREIVALAGGERILEQARKFMAEGNEAMALQFVDMLLVSGLDAGQEREMHRLKAELLGRLGDKEPSFIARNILYNGHNQEMKLAGVEEQG